MGRKKDEWAVGANGKKKKRVTARTGNRPLFHGGGKKEFKLKDKEKKGPAASIGKEGKKGVSPCGRKKKRGGKGGGKADCRPNGLAKKKTIASLMWGEGFATARKKKTYFERKKKKKKKGKTGLERFDGFCEIKWADHRKSSTEGRRNRNAQTKKEKEKKKKKSFLEASVAGRKAIYREKLGEGKGKGMRKSSSGIPGVIDKRTILANPPETIIGFREGGLDGEGGERRAGEQETNQLLLSGRERKKSCYLLSLKRQKGKTTKGGKKKFCKTAASASSLGEGEGKLAPKGKLDIKSARREKGGGGGYLIKGTGGRHLWSGPLRA